MRESLANFHWKFIEYFINRWVITAENAKVLMKNVPTRINSPLGGNW